MPAAERAPQAGTEPQRILDEVRSRGHACEAEGLSIFLAEDFGFCQGVEQAVARALAAARALRAADPAIGGGEPGRLWVTGEIIHNPAINEALRRAGAERLPPPESPDRLAAVRPADTVIVPAFGIEVDEEERLRRIGCRVVDTTCGWVRRVWKAAREFSRAGLTVVIHGKREHEETRATASRIDGPWIVVRDREEARRLAAWVSSAPDEGNGLLAAAGPGFDPPRHLARLGLVNQTTMLSAETEEIARILRAALAARLGAEPGPKRFRVMDTLCPATQRRQDAVQRLIDEHPLDLLIVVGGFRSSNTAHLARIGRARVPSYHVEDADCLIDRRRIRHLPAGAEGPVVTEGWLPDGQRVIGVSAGASTPDQETGRILLGLLALRARPEGEP